MGSQLFTDFVGALGGGTGQRSGGGSSTPAAASVAPVDFHEGTLMAQRSFTNALEERLRDVLEGIPAGGAVEVALFDCYRRLNFRIDSARGCSLFDNVQPLQQPARSSRYVLMLRACRAGAEDAAAAAIDDVCR